MSTSCLVPAARRHQNPVIPACLLSGSFTRFQALQQSSQVSLPCSSLTACSWSHAPHAVPSAYAVIW